MGLPETKNAQTSINDMKILKFESLQMINIKNNVMWGNFEWNAYNTK